MQTILALTSGQPPPPLPGSVPRPISDVVYRALEHAPANRFATAAAMQQAIEDAMVATKLGTGTAAVASFLCDHLADRGRARKETILLGLKAAADRENYASLLRSSIQTMTASATAKFTNVPLVQPPPQPARDSAVTAGTLGSAAMGLVPRRIAGNRASIRVAASTTVLGVAALATMVLRLSAAQPGPSAGRSALGSLAPQKAPTHSEPTPSPAAQPEELPSPAEATGAQDAAPAARSTPAASTVRAAAAPSSPAKGRPRKPRIDDGF